MIKQVTTQTIIINISPEHLRKIADSIEKNPTEVKRENLITQIEETINQYIKIEVQFLNLPKSK